jgi:hypothetical protein
MLDFTMEDLHRARDAIDKVSSGPVLACSSVFRQLPAPKT